MPEFSGMPVVVVHLDAITANFSLLAQKAGASQREGAGADEDGFAWPAVMPVIKADAYGHGHIETGIALARAGARVLASGSMAEAAELRQGLAKAGLHVPIVSLLGLCLPGDVDLASAYDVIPVVHSFWQLKLLEGRVLPGARGGEMPIAVKFNTGMARLGFNPGEMTLLKETLRGLSGVRAELGLSHLHSADTADGVAQAQAQARVFAGMLDAMGRERPRAVSLCNSAGTLLAEYVTPILGPHVCRPGVALYGSNPFAGTSLAGRGKGLSRAMAVHAPVMAVRTLEQGEGIGYGQTWSAVRRTEVGIIAAGYADGFSRGLSNKGAVCVQGKRAPIIGRVSMQMSAVDLSAVYAAGNTVAPGEAAHILGGPYAAGLDADELAELWGTISYEVLCILGRNKKEYRF